MYTGQINSVLDLISLPIDDFVDESYRILLSRTPGLPEKTERAGVLRAGLGRIQFLADMGRSPEYLQRHEQMLRTGDDTTFIHALFHRYLNRAPDSDGLHHYTKLLMKGKGRTRIARDVARSREARGKRTFWYELEHLIAVNRAERHWLRRWFGHGPRQRLLRNLGHEALLQHNLTHARVPQHLPAAVAHAALNPHVPDNAAHLHMDTRNQGHDTRRAMSRLQHAARSF
ncbi:DUF4214 domain-containing protein [Novosphingobium sp. 9U]|uniref:DUF4214 domain-containing protein n=1 Tax=Novosphingobium sp. 9U TaxID=2653158 RepID=UPI0012F0E364|nr:DUF4214 domain-containing protein [Novosphingobium sp. 9U]VWX53248.1 conserved hypothetical protein [Novosphingobium sp. 9U]